MSSVTVLSTLQRPTLSAQVARHLLALINREQLRPGDTVPSEVQIGRDLQISRGSVREAYRTLAALGILEIEGGRRPRLRPVDSQFLVQVFDYALNTAQVSLAHVLETRRAIEQQNAQLAARYATPEQRSRLRELAAQMRAALPDHARRVACDMAIHTVIAEASGNPLNALLLGALSSPVEESSRMHLHDSRSEAELLRIIEAHEAVVERVCAGDAVGAASAMSYHFDFALVHVNRQQQALDQAAAEASRLQAAI
jgi:GntR family transcriptional regulator, transcriptional repressor for pyruvate dehydrogenase complex